MRSTRLRTVGLILGPYRNLTTLTASLLSLHPECQVLNHAGQRLLRGRRDFVRRFDEERLDRFCEAALEASAEGRRGGYGGSIRFSHAFDREELRTAYETRYGDKLMKDVVSTLVWKESELVTQRIRSAPDRIGHLVEGTDRLRFLMPVRQPLDCAESNIRMGYANRIPGADPNDIKSVADAIVEMIGWFSRLAEANPHRFFMFYEDDDSATVLDGLTATLDLEDDAEWRSAAASAFTVSGKTYSYSPEVFEAFDDSVRRHLGDLPAVSARILELVRPARPA